MRATKFVRLRRLLVATAMGAGIASAVGHVAVIHVQNHATAHADASTLITANGGTVAQARSASADELTWG